MGTIQLANEKFLPMVLEYISQGHTATIRAKGYSMRPFIENERDDIVLAAADKYTVGDVVLAEITPGQFVLHRIDAISGENVRLRGDGNYRGTERCRLTDVKAKAVQVIRKGTVWNIEKSRVWKTYSWIWTRLLPVRRYLLWGLRKVKFNR